MATDMRPGDKDEFTERDVRHSCSLCMEPYRGRNPKILPCFHTFCLPCLMSLETSAITATSETGGNADEESDVKVEDLKGEQRENKGVIDQSGGGCDGDDARVSRADAGRKPVFLCPTCRAPVSVPEGGVSSLQTNFYVVHEQSTDVASPPVLCDMCEDGNQQPASYHCHQCQMGICRSCRRYHDKLMPKHQVTGTSLSRPGKGKKAKEEEEEKKGFCLVHRDQALCFHCRQCEVSTCLHCKLTSHEGHDTVDLATAALQAKKDMVPLITTTQQQLQVLDSSIQRVNQEDGQLTRHAQQATQRINTRYESLVTWAREARDQLLEEVSAKEASSRGLLAAEKSSMALVRDALSSLLTRAARATSTDPDVVMVKNELKEALLSDEKLDSYKERAARENNPWGWDYDVMDASVIHADDVKVYIGRVVEGAGVGMTKLPVSLRELADRVDRWMNETTETTNTLTSQLTSCKNDVAALQKKEAELEKKLKSVDDEVTASKKREDDLGRKTESLNTDVQKKFSSLSDDLSAQKRSAADLQKTMQSVKQKIETSGKMISFVAQGLDDQKTKNGSPIVFDSASINNGGCYDATTGYFTVTVPGCYMFTSSIGSRENDAAASGHITVDDTQYTYIRGSYSCVGCGSMSVQLKRGQKVWVRANSNASRYCGCELSFTGALVQPEL